MSVITLPTSAKSADTIICGACGRYHFATFSKYADGLRKEKEKAHNRFIEHKAKIRWVKVGKKEVVVGCRCKEGERLTALLASAAE